MTPLETFLGCCGRLEHAEPYAFEPRIFFLSELDLSNAISCSLTTVML